LKARAVLSRRRWSALDVGASASPYRFRHAIVGARREGRDLSAIGPGSRSDRKSAIGGSLVVLENLTCGVGPVVALSPPFEDDGGTAGPHFGKSAAGIRGKTCVILR
jgi:hypothetical protein